MKPVLEGSALVATATALLFAAGAGGRWLRIMPDPAFLTAPDSRRRALVATTEALTTSPCSS